MDGDKRKRVSGKSDFLYDILPTIIDASGIYHTLTEQHTATQPRMEAANVKTEAMAKSARST